MRGSQCWDMQISIENMRPYQQLVIFYPLDISFHVPTRVKNAIEKERITRETHRKIAAVARSHPPQQIRR